MPGKTATNIPIGPQCMKRSQDKNCSRRDDLGWDTLLVLCHHALLLLTLLGLFWFALPLLGTLLGDFRGQFPWPMQQLFNTIGFVRHPLLCLVVALAGLWGDARAYRWLCTTRGKRSATLYATGISCLLAVVIIWYVFLFGRSICWIGERQQTLMIQQQTEQRDGAVTQEPVPCSLPSSLRLCFARSVSN
jgi:hypothetical protein